MDLPQNAFKRRLLAGEVQIGLWCSMSSGYAAQMVAGAGFDWLLFDTEHSPGGVETVLAQLQAVQGYPVSAVVRPAVNDTALIKKYLDIGVQTLLIPYVQSVQEAQAAVAAIRYPPEGLRGVAGTTRASGFGRVKDYTRLAAGQLCLLVQVETGQALEQLEAIAAVDGVDGVFIGPNDLAASLGHPGDPGHPEVVDAIEGALARLKAMGKPSGLYTSPDFARRCIALGAGFAAVGGDIGLLVKAADKLAADFKTA
jgi:4-hydroxy-2-oxoheptanedioate aldolase